MKRSHDPNGAIVPEKLPLSERILCWITVVIIVVGAVWISVALR